VNPEIYLDYCATTPVHPDVRAAMLSALTEDFGNPSSMHWAGRRAVELISQARRDIAAGIGSRPEEIYFTSGATEADNLALFGILRQYKPGSAHLITSAIEHHAILHASSQLEREGYEVTILPVDSQGLVDPQSVRQAIRSNTVLISVMLVNNETGAIQPVEEIGAMAAEHGILMHTDAVQGIGHLDVNVHNLNVHLLSLSAHKIYGPKGIGALYIREGVRIMPVAHGGTQEKALRPGTENVPGIVGLGAAFRFTQSHKAEERKRQVQLRNYLMQGLKARIPQVVVNGPSEKVAPHVISVSFLGCDGEMMLIRLNGKGFAVSMGSACTSKSIEPSHVLTAMGLSREQVEGTLRISLGYPTTESELDCFLEAISSVVQQSKNSEEAA
jgi:cysteine desulfurase